jgi:hypothetical protein
MISEDSNPANPFSEALRLSEDDSKPRIKDIVNSVIDVIFLGTPHRGNMDEITLEEAVIQAACLILRLEVGSARVQSLDMEASEILRSRESFMRLWKMYDFRVKTFHEAYDSDCSKSGISNRMVRHIPAPSLHPTTTKNLSLLFAQLSHGLMIGRPQIFCLI